MRLNINQVCHNYIVRIVIFSIFLYKRQLREPDIFIQSVKSFCKKRLSIDIHLKIDTGEKLPKYIERDIIIDEILSGREYNFLKTIKVEFITPHKEVTMNIDLNDESKYENFLYI